MDPDLARRLKDAFARGSGHGLLQLGAGEVGVALPPAFSFWRELGTRYVTALCTLPDLATDHSKVRVPAPPVGELEPLALASPPMTGAEYLSRPHRSDIWIGLLKHLGRPISERRPALRLSDEQKAFCDRFLREHSISAGDVVLGVHPGARIPLRRWGDGNFMSVARQLAHELPATVVWFLGPNEPEPREPPQESRLVFVRLPLPHFVAVLARCNLLLCNDSGPMHVANAPTFLLFSLGSQVYPSFPACLSIAIFSPIALRRVVGMA